MSSLARFGLILAVTSFGLAACTIASPTHITVQPTKTTDGTDPKSKGDDDDNDAPQAAGEAAGGDAVTCSADDFTKPDLSTLTACGNGKGHCFDRDKTPMAEEMVACDSDTVCVPDEILTSGGDTLYACSVQALGGAEGACITASLFPTIISQGGSALTQDVCDAGQLCVPCKDPTHNNAPTPFCQKIGVHASACGNAQANATTADAGAQESELCCTTDGVSHGICIDNSAIPADQQSKTIRDTCHNASNKCVPKAMVEGNPVTCDSGIAGKGICMDKCFNKWMSAAGSIGALSTDGCEAHEVCVPCLAAGSGTPGCN